MKTRSIANSIVGQQCPRCRSASIFVTGPYDLRRFAKMHPRCPNCGQSLDPEPGFFTGAMYVSYGLQVFAAITAFLVVQVLVTEVPIAVHILVISLVVLSLLPITFRLSRSIWLHLFFAYGREVWHGKR